MAEEIVFGPDQVTTGASNDIERATEIARNMVTKWGLSDRLGPQAYSEEEGEVFLGHAVSRHKQVSDETTHVIDEEVRTIIGRNYERARAILISHRDQLDLMAEALVKYETIDDAQIRDILAGKVPRPPAGWNDMGGSPAVATPVPPGGAPKEGTIGGPASQH